MPSGTYGSMTSAYRIRYQTCRISHPRTRATLVNLRRQIDVGAAILKQYQAAFGNFKWARDVVMPTQVAIDRFLRRLQPRVAATAIAQRDPAERNAFLTRWFMVRLSTTFPADCRASPAVAACRVTG